MSECPFEGEVLDAIASRRWPARADTELRAHVETCGSCADLADVAGGLLLDEDAAYAAANVPPAGTVWQRAQIRAREDAVRTAARPMGFVQGLAFASALAACIAAAVWGLPLLASLLPDVSNAAGAVRLPSIALPSVDIDAKALLSNAAIQIALAVWAVLLPTALYFTLRDSSS